MINAILRLATGICALLLAGITLIVGWEVAMRYIAGQPTLWVHDISVYALLWFAFLGLASAEHGGQSFSRPITISSSEHYSVRPDLTVDSAGNVNAIWAVWDGYPFVYPFIPEIYYARGMP